MLEIAVLLTIGVFGFQLIWMILNFFGIQNLWILRSNLGCLCCKKQLQTTVFCVNYWKANYSASQLVNLSTGNYPILNWEFHKNHSQYRSLLIYVSELIIFDAMQMIFYSTNSFWLFIPWIQNLYPNLWSLYFNWTDWLSKLELWNLF